MQCSLIEYSISNICQFLNLFIDINLTTIKRLIGHFNGNWQAHSKFCIETQMAKNRQDSWNRWRKEKIYFFSDQDVLWSSNTQWSVVFVHR